MSKEKPTKVSPEARLKRVDDSLRVLGWSWGELARRVGVQAKTVSAWKTGRNAVPVVVMYHVELLAQMKEMDSWWSRRMKGDKL